MRLHTNQHTASLKESLSYEGIIQSVLPLLWESGEAIIRIPAGAREDHTDDPEKEVAEKNAQEKPRTKPKVTFKDVPSVPKKKIPVKPAISTEIERLRKKFSGES